MDNGTLPVTDAYHPWSRIEEDRWYSDFDLFKRKIGAWRERVGNIIESRGAHLFILFLLTIDITIVLVDLGHDFLSSHCGDDTARKPTWLRALGHVSLGITSAFLIEIVLALFAFGLRFYNPFSGFPLAALHLFDAFVIIITFVLELVLKGKGEEFAALFIILRFWRIVKLMEGVALGAGEINAEAAEDLAATKARLLQTQDDLAASQNEIGKLRRRLQAAGISPDALSDNPQEG